MMSRDRHTVDCHCFFFSSRRRHTRSDRDWSSDVCSSDLFQIPGVMSKTYEYYYDGRVYFSSDLIDHRFDRSYSYDHAARIMVALSGAEARGQGATPDRPYWESFGYDAIGHLTARTTYQWSSAQLNISDSYTNNRHDPV